MLYMKKVTILNFHIGIHRLWLRREVVFVSSVPPLALLSPGHPLTYARNKHS